jgi:EAL domain-containing protein (putative c-di-GMP-specific phosphodiesterase class I)
VVARIGGDKFVILLDYADDIHEAIHIASCIKASLRLPFSIQGRVIRTSASIGILFNNNTYNSSDHLLRDVDIALYRAKAEGRDRYEIFGAEMFQMTLKRVNLENDLHGAIAQQQFVTHYQPIYTLPGQRLVGFEALVRWQKPDHGLIMPLEFIDLAEETGLIVAITYQVIEQVCQAIQQWQTDHLIADRFRVAINILGQSFRDDEFLPMLDQSLEKVGLSPQRLTLEITERILLEQSTSILETLTSIKARGMRLSIDDFGTGYSSLKYLSRFPVDILKIDKSFVNEMQQNGQGIVRAIIDLAQNLGMITVAEGVEYPWQMQQLVELGCQVAQGYLFSKPLPFEAATQLMRSGTKGVF